MDERSWGVELWDQSDNLLQFCQEENDVTSNYLGFLKDIQKMHSEIGKLYKKTIASYMPKKIPETHTTFHSTFFSLLKPYLEMGKVHEQMSNEINDQILTGYKVFMDEQKVFLSNASKKREDLLKMLDDAKKRVEKSWTAYLAAHREKIRASEQCSKANSDEFLPRIEQRKFEDIYKMKTREYETASMKYAKDLQNYNQYCIKYNLAKNMDFISELEENEANRLAKTKQLLDKTTGIHVNNFGRLLQMAESCEGIVAQLDPKKDREAVLNRYRTEYHYPAEAQYLNLDDCPNALLEGPQYRLINWLLGEPDKIIQDRKEGKSRFGFLGGGNKKKEEMVSLASPFFGGLGLKHLRLPEMTIMQVFSRIAALDQRLDHVRKELEASAEMEDIYLKTPALGDSQSVEKRKASSQRQIKSLEAIRNQFDARYQELGGDQARISRVDQNQKSFSAAGKIPAAMMPTDACHYLGTNNTCASDDEFADGSDEYEGETPQVPNEGTLSGSSHSGIGKAVAKFDYEGNGDSYPSVHVGDTFEVTEFDTDNSGWTAILTSSGQAGFVPTGFMEITKY